MRPPLWRRSPVVPAAIAVLAVWTGVDLPHLLAEHGSQGSVRRAAGAQLSLSALAGAGAGAALPAAVAQARRVSRESRNVARTSRPVPQPPTPANTAPANTVAGTWVRPSAGVESSCFCMRWGLMHEGVDLAGPLGSPILAVGDGVVVAAGPASGFGRWVVIRHGNGDYSIYGHMYSYLVTVGQRVRAGQHIADIGANGRSTGPHLHFGIAHGSATGPYEDPVPWLKARGIDIGAYDPTA